MKILLVEDDAMIGETLQKALRRAGYCVDWTQDGEDAAFCVRDKSYALVILDLGLPGIGGLSILKSMRKEKNDLPVLILTARDGVKDRVSGLDAGADEYMLKPFALEELEARIRLLLRRTSGQHVPTLSVGAMRLDPATHEIYCNGKKHVLSVREFALMHMLMEKPGVIFSRAQMEERLYGWNEEIESNSVEVHIHQIRRKLGRQAIKNTRGVGYSIGLTS